MPTENNVFIFLALLVAFLISFAATPMVIALAPKIHAIDVPKDTRRVHKKPIPLIGGLAIFYGFVISVLCFGIIDREMAGVLIGAVILVTTGIIDDIIEMKAILKLLFQIIAAAVVVLCGVEIGHLTNPFYGWFGPEYISFGIFSAPLTVVWIVGVTNAVNLIDGLDGLAVGVSSIASVALLALTLLAQNLNVAILAAAVAGACIGFLPYNFNPAKIFMGDTGAMFLGYILACISVQGLLKTYAVITFAAPILVLGLPIFDTMFAILRRLFTGKPIMAPDRGHLHHRLIDMGLSQRQAVLVLYTLTAALCLTAVVTAMKGPERGILLIAAVLLIILFTMQFMVAPKLKRGEKTDEHSAQAEEEGKDE